MKLSSTLLVVAVLLLTGTLARAAQTSSLPADPTGGSPAFLSPVQAGCNAAELPSFDPRPSEQAGALCGSCSQSPCAGQRTGAICSFKNGQWYACQAVLGETCSVDGKLNCSCWAGPLP